MNQLWKHKQKTVSHGFVLATMSVLALSLPLTAKMVEQSHDLRSSAAENNYSLEISPQRQYVSVGYTTKFKAKLSDNIKNKTVVWSTNNKRIIKINEKTGEILGMVPGEATVYAYNQSAKLRVSAKVYVKTYFEVMRYPKMMRVGEKNKIDVVVSPNSRAYFESSNQSVISVTNVGGALTAKKKGIAIIKITAKDTSENKKIKISVR